MIDEIRWRRRRWLAPLLSAAIPGLGQAVTARWGSAVTFFLFFAAPVFFSRFIPREWNVGHSIMVGFLAITWALNVLEAWGGTTRPTAPCVQACPANIDIPRYLNLALEGRVEDCHEFICGWTPLVATVGHVCHHPCEAKCTRHDFDQPVAICPIKAHVGNRMIEGGRLAVVPRPSLDERSPRVAVVGSGPAGLTAAFFLARLGVRSTVFEALPAAGGMLAVGIPSYRLPRRVLKAELDFIREQGVVIRTGVEVGKDVTIDQLFGEGYRALYAAPGTHRESLLRVEGENLPGVTPGLTFLREVNLGRMGWLEGDVVVVGGGNVAMDAARCALRLGAASVTVVYRRSRLEMPANSWEVEEAEEEGVRFRFLTAPTRVVGTGAVEGLECLQMRLAEPDASGRRRPVPVEGSEEVIRCRHVIPAIGLTPKTGFLDGSGVRLDKGGLIITRKPGSPLTHRKGVWAGGDAVTGPASVIGACRQGRDAAMAIAAALGARPAWRFRTIKPGRVQSEFASRSRVPQSSRQPGERRGDFRLIHRVYEPEACASEGRRCLRCDLEM